MISKNASHFLRFQYHIHSVQDWFVLFAHLDPSVYVVGYCQVSGDPCLSVHISEWRTLDKYLWLWQIPLPLFKSVSPTDLTLEQGGWATSAWKSQCLGSSRPASKEEPSWLSEKRRFLHRGSTVVCFISGKRWVSLSFCTTIMDTRLLGITLLLLTPTLPTADPSASSVAVLRILQMIPHCLLWAEGAAQVI